METAVYSDCCFRVYSCAALQVTDACVTFSKERHETSINAIKVSVNIHQEAHCPRFFETNSLNLCDVSIAGILQTAHHRRVD